MRDQEFRKLLDKYLDGSISKEEEELLDQFKEGLKSQYNKPKFQSEADKLHMEKSLWTGITSQTNKPYTKRKSTHWIIAASAAVFIGLVTTSFFFWQNSKSNTLDAIPKNAITLKHEDGSIQIINEDWDTKVLDKTGNVLGLQKGNQLIYKEINSVEELVYNTLAVPYGKTFELQLSDGTMVHLNAGSSLKYPVKFISGKERKIFLTGEVYLDVAKDSLHPFIISADKLNIRVLGTQFNVSAYPEDDTTDIVLVEGSVGLFREADGYDIEKSTTIDPGFKGSFNRKKNSITTKAVITSVYTSWMNSVLVFRNMSFENILKKLERHYDVIIINNNKDLAQKQFNANFGNESIENVLEELKTIYAIDYEIMDKKIIIK